MIILDFARIDKTQTPNFLLYRLNILKKVALNYKKNPEKIGIQFYALFSLIKSLIFCSNSSINSGLSLMRAFTPSLPCPNFVSP